MTAETDRYRLIRWERWRRFLRRHGIPVPAFMLPLSEEQS